MSHEKRVPTAPSKGIKRVRGALPGTKKLKCGALRKGPPFHGSRSSREIKIQNAAECKLSNGQSRSYKVIKLLLSAGT